MKEEKENLGKNLN